MKMYGIATVPGDGIGKEVIPAGRKEHLGEFDAARRLMNAIERVTADLRTANVTAGVCAECIKA